MRAAVILFSVLTLTFMAQESLAFETFLTKPGLPICTDTVNSTRPLPIIRMYSSAVCDTCQLIQPIFRKVAEDYTSKGLVKAKLWDMAREDDLMTPAYEGTVPGDEQLLFFQYSQGAVPTFIFGCKYYRISIGYDFTSPDFEEKEEAEFREVINQLLTELGICQVGTCPVGKVCCNDSCIFPLCANNSQCDDGNACTRDLCLGPGTCGSSCSNTQLSECSGGDGCCPSGCYSSIDSDCTTQCASDANCGQGMACCDGVCKKSVCSQDSACDDSDSCTTDSCSSPGTCTSSCLHTPKQCANGDGCCPSGCLKGIDSDCTAECITDADCGQGRVCCAGSCKVPACSGSSDCQKNDSCTIVMCKNAGLCDAFCSSMLQTGCRNSDGCCPSGCTSNTDDDCTYECLGDKDCLGREIRVCCANICSRPACLSDQDCDDGIGCTEDRCTGPKTCNASCSHVQKTACVSGDGCCPEGCAMDADCGCGDLESEMECISNKGCTWTGLTCGNLVDEGLSTRTSNHQTTRPSASNEGQNPPAARRESPGPVKDESIENITSAIEDDAITAADVIKDNWWEFGLLCVLLVALIGVYVLRRMRR
jgi:hypothetical protein